MFEIARVIDKMIQYFDGDMRRIQHSLKVYEFGRVIGIKENLSLWEQQCLELAAILHDIGIKESEKKYQSSAGCYQEIEGPPIAKKLLSPFSLDQELLQRVLFLIGHHHSYQAIEGNDFQILVEADFLVNMYEEKMSIEALKSMEQKIFKTNTGKAYLKAYLKFRENNKC